MNRFPRNTITIVTPAYGYPTWYMPRFYANACKYFEPDDVRVVRHSGEFNGAWNEKMYYFKLTNMLEYVKGNVTSEYIMGLDGTDTNFYSSAENILQLFEDASCSILFCAEKGLWPHTSYNHLYPSKNVVGDYKYLNAGGWIGYTKDVVRYMEKIESTKTTNPDMLDDQGRWATEYLLNGDIKIDSENKIFFSSLESKSIITVENNRPKIIGYDPIIVHDNGPHGDKTTKITELL